MRSKRNKAVIALAVTSMLLSSVNVKTFAATKKEAIVTSQAELNAQLKAMGKKGIGKIVLENNKKADIKIPKGSFNKVKLHVAGSKLSVENKAKFKSINLEGDGVKKFVEAAKNNSIKVTSSKAKIVVSNKAVLKSLNCSGDNLSLTVNKGSKIAKILANNGVRTLTLNVNGKVDNATIKAAGVQVKVKGAADDTNLVIEGENVSLKAETAVKLTLLNNADITFEKGAEKSVIEVKEGVEAKIANNTAEKITVNTPEGEKTVSSGEKLDKSTVEDNKKTENKKTENKKEENKTDNSSSAGTGGTSSGGGSTNPGGGNTNPGGGNTNPGGGNTNPGGGNTNPGNNENIKSGFGKKASHIDLKPAFYPVVRNITFNNEGLEIKGKLNVAVVSDKDSPAVKKFFELLKEYNVEYTLIDEKNVGKADIILGTKAAKEKAGIEKFFADKALQNEQGYVLNCVKEADSHKVFLVGASNEGLYYGVMSFRQLLQDKKDCGYLPVVSISDYPSIPLRGIVEGYYGYPWSFKEKMGLITDSSKYKMNVYIYAPKDDPYHKDRWRDLYPDDKAEELRQLAEVSKAHNVSFCWNIHPGNIYGTGNDFDLLMKKFEQLYELGVRQFGVSYDDINGSYARRHVDVINKVNKEFVQKKGDVKPLIVVGTRYAQAWGPSVESYLKPFLTGLDDDVIVMWTGAETMGTLNKADFEWPGKQTGSTRKLAAWWNYPVIDYADGKMLMGPLDGVYNDADNLLGVFLNPMPHAQASRISIFSGADYCWNLDGFEKMSSWRRAIKELVPNEKEAFERFADNLAFLQKEKLDFDESRYIKDKLAEFMSVLSKKESIAEKGADLKKEFELLIADCDVLRNMENKDLFKEIEPFVNAYEEVAKAGVAVMEGILAVEKNDFDTALNSIDVFEKAIKKARTFTVKSLEDHGTERDNIVEVCEKRIKPFIKDVAGSIRQSVVNGLKVDSEASVYTSTGDINKELKMTGGNYIAGDLNATLKKNDYIELKLPRALKIAKVSVTGAALEGADLKFSYSINTEKYDEEELKGADGRLSTENPISASVIRITNKGDKEVKIDEIKAMIVYGVSNVEAETKLNHYQHYTINKAVDGNINTNFWSNGGPSAGSYIRVDLGKSVPLYDLEIYYADNPKGREHGIDGFFDTKLEISEDGVTWIQVGDIIEAANYQAVAGTKLAKVEFDANGKMGRYLKFSTTKQSENWVQVYEVFYNKKANNLGDDSVELIESDCTIKGKEKLYDGNISTISEITGTAEGKYLAYKLSKTDSKNIYIIQDKESICNAEVQAKVDGEWVNLGILDSRFSKFTIAGTKVTEVKLIFKSNETVKLCEILAK